MEDDRTPQPSQSNPPKLSSTSYVYPVRSLLEGRILRAENPRGLGLQSAARSSDSAHGINEEHNIALPPSPLFQAENIALEEDPDAGNLSSGGVGPSKGKKKTKKAPRAQSTSVSHHPSSSPATISSNRRAPSKVKSRKSPPAVEGSEPNYRHFPAGENPYFSPSFIPARGAPTFSSTHSQVDMAIVPSAMSADHVLGSRPFVHPSSESMPLPLAVSESLSLMSPSLLPSPPIINEPSRAHRDVSPAEEITASPSRYPLSQRGSFSNSAEQTPSLEISGILDAQKDLLGQISLKHASQDDHNGRLPFYPSEYGLVHLPPLPISGPGSECAASSSSSAQRSGATTSSRRPGSSLAAIVAPGAAPTSPSNPQESADVSQLPIAENNIAPPSQSDAQSRSGLNPSPNPPGSSSEPQSGSEDTRSSLESEENLVTFRFQYRQTEEGHQVVVGREGKLQRCEDEPIRTPGAVQGFGVLIAVDEMEDTLVVRQVSENSSDLLGLPPKYLFELECFTDTLPDDQVGILWDNIQFLSEPAMRSEEDGGGPHVFLLRGYGAPGSAIPNEGEAHDGKRAWTCWCAVHRAEAYSSTDSVSPGLIVMEFELERDPHNPLYPPVSIPTTSTSGTDSPSGSMAGSSTDGSEATMKPGDIDSPASESVTPGISIPSSIAGSTASLLLDSSRNSSATPSSMMPSSLNGLEGDDEWTPSAEEVIESTTSYSKPLPALERLRRMTRGAPGPNSASTAEITASSSSSRRAGRRGRGSSSTVGMMDVFAVMAQINEQLGSAPDLDMFLKIVVGVIKDLTQFHRVMVYQFDEMWNGKVVAELLDWNQSHDLFRGLHFPAGDIPAQARELYKINKVRLLYDRGQQTARIVVRNKDDLATPLNMTHCYLRAMSPIHVQYLANMGVRASMSISIMAFDQLWGLVMCHSYGQHGMRVSFPVRQMLRLLSQSISRNIERLSYAQRLHTRKLINTMSSEHHPTGYIVSNADDLIGLFDADFAILVIGESAKIFGPNQHGQEVLIMCEYLRMKQFTTIQASQAVISDFPDLSLTTGLEVMAGLLYVPLSSEGKDFIALLRKGQRKKVNWAGKPFKSDQDQNVLEPRRSFKIWSEEVAGRCKAWTDEQLETAGVLALVYGKFIEVWREKENALQTTKITNILLSNASHEVRTPLNHIINYLEMAMNGHLDLETRDNLSRSHAASKNLLFTINDLLDLTRLESGNEVALNEPFDLHAAIEDACSMYRREAARRNVKFTLDLTDSPRTVIGDSKKIVTVVQNLTANALKYTSKGAVAVSCMMFLEPEGLRQRDQVAVEIVVSDTGCGIVPNKLEQIFKEFEQVESAEPKSNAEEGVGLGLAVVARIVEQLGGRLRVDSTADKGSRFSFLIPLALPSDEPTVPSTSSGSSRGSFGSHSRTGSLFSKGSGQNELESLVQAISSNHMAPSRRPSLRRQSRESIKSVAGSSHPPSGGVLEVTGPQYPVHPVKVDEIAQQTTSPSPNASAVEKTNVSSAQERMSLRQRKQFAEASGTSSKLRILIVEDNDINRMIMAKRLTMDGHTIVNTANGLEGLEKVTTDRAFDLILMDIQMPLMNGFEATQAIRKLEQEQSQAVLRISHALNSRIPIFAFSASLQEQQRDKLSEHGLDGWILKPIDFKRLRTLLQGITDPLQRERDTYKAGCSWEAGGWLSKP